MGLNFAFDTFSSQAKGAGNMDLVGVYLNRARLINFLVFIPIYFILGHTSQALVAIGQKEKTAELAQQYVMAYFPALVLTSLIYVETIFLNLMEYVRVPLVSWLIGGIFHFTLCY